MLLALKNNPNLKSKFLAHAKCQRMREEYQQMSYHDANVAVIDSFVEQVQSKSPPRARRARALVRAWARVCR